MKNYKKLCLALVILMICYICFVSIDCIRLRNSEFYTRPLITVKEEKINSETMEIYNKYTGLGYTIEYAKLKDNIANAIERSAVSTKSVDFKLFGNILIWAWIE